MMKKLLLPFVVIVGFAGFVVYGRVKAVPQSTGASASVAVTPTVPTASASTSTVHYKDGTYTGSVADAYYGNVQVQATIADGAVTDVEFLQYPDTSGNTIAVSQRSMPLLKAEAVSVQSANVDIVSGATQTSQAFQQSLAAALSQAS